MPELRWIIAVIGLAVIVALYIWGRRLAVSRKDKAGRVEPRLDDVAPRDLDQSSSYLSGSRDEWVQFPETEIRREPDRGLEGERDLPRVTGTSQTGGRSPQKIVVLYVRAAGGRDFTGPELMAAFEGEGLEYGKYGAFHQFGDRKQSFFMIANMVEPGSFPIDDMENFTTTGITAFMVLPGPAGVDGLARMVACCRRLASILGGEVLDENRSTLTNQRATHMKEEIIEFLRQSRLDPSGIKPGSD
jgi:cell division protein ZipA